MSITPKTQIDITNSQEFISMIFYRVIFKMKLTKQAVYMYLKYSESLENGLFTLKRIFFIFSPPSMHKYMFEYFHQMHSFKDIQLEPYFNEYMINKNIKIFTNQIVPARIALPMQLKNLFN